MTIQLYACFRIYFVDFFAVVLMGHLTVVGAEAEEIRHILAEGMRAIDSKRPHLCILQETMTGTILLLLQVIMATLRSRCGHYIFALWFLSIFFFYFSPNLSGRRLDVYHTSTHGVALQI